MTPRNEAPKILESKARGQNKSSANLPNAPESWLEDSIAKLRSISLKLSSATGADEVIRRAIVEGRETLGFNRLSVWFFDDNYHSLTGTWGVNADGEIVDERHQRVFDHGSIKPQREAWERSPYYFLATDDALRDSEGGIIARGVRFTVPLLKDGTPHGYLTVDNLLESPAINEKTGPLLTLYADTIAAHYFTKIADEHANVAKAASEQAENIKREFLGMLSHEVRTPLNAILGFAQLICLNSSTTEQQELTKTIEKSGEHLLDLLSSMMDYANLANDQSNTHTGPCDPIQIARETVESFTQFAKQKDLEISFAHAGEMEGAVLANNIGIRQVITNLVQNSIKFTDSGSIRVRTQSQSKPNGQVAIQIAVEDSGCGMRPEHQDVIFRPFKQIDSSLTRSHGGIGMGLAIVDRLVKSMGGHITLKSVLGQGTQFSVDFTFNYETEAPKVIQSPIGTRSPSQKKKEKLRILVADSDESNSKLLRLLLEKFGYKAIGQIDCGVRASALIAANPYDLVIVDLQLPELDGLALTRLVRKGSCGPINRDVPIIGISTDAAESERSFTAGMNVHMIKPFKVEHLQSTIQNLVAT